MARKFGLGIVAGAALAWGLVGGAARAATDISFWTWRQEDKTAYNELFADFMRQNPDLRVGFESFPDENYPTIVSTALSAGKGGDVIHTHAYGWLEQFVKSGYLVRLDPANVLPLANMPPDALRGQGKRTRSARSAGGAS